MNVIYRRKEFDACYTTVLVKLFGLDVRTQDLVKVAAVLACVAWIDWHGYKTIPSDTMQSRHKERVGFKQASPACLCPKETL